MTFPFEASSEEVVRSPGEFVDAVFSSLVSDFLAMPKGVGFLDYGNFSAAYEALKRVSKGFVDFECAAVANAAREQPVILVVLRAILGFTPPEWAYAAANRTGITIPQNAVRSLDRRIREKPTEALRLGRTTERRVDALVQTACEMIKEGCPQRSANVVHRLEKADTLDGVTSVRRLSELGVPYAMLLYERYLGRPFAGHRDSVSELVGDKLELAIEKELARARISFRKTKRAERIAGFDQAPDFIVPDEFDPRIVIEAKVTEDDGTARDKVTRIIRLCHMSEERARRGMGGYQVIACLAGRGFGVRREDMRQVIVHTKGKVFTPQTLDRLVPCSDLVNFCT